MIDPQHLPILGEPLAVEFANSAYRMSDGLTLDCLGNAAMTELWFAYVPTGQHLRLPSRISSGLLTDIAMVRDAIRDFLDSITAGRAVRRSNVDVLNRSAARSNSHIRLSIADEATPVANFHHLGSAADVLIASLATECISFLAGPLLSTVRRCEGADCHVLFVQHHRKRRFCHDGCSHRARQSRYYHANRDTKAVRSLAVNEKHLREHNR